MKSAEFPAGQLSPPLPSGSRKGFIDFISEISFFIFIACTVVVSCADKVVIGR